MGCTEPLPNIGTLGAWRGAVLKDGSRIRLAILKYPSSDTLGNAAVFGGRLHFRPISTRKLKPNELL